VTRSWMSSSTDRSWPARVNSTYSRCDRLLKECTSSRMRIQRAACIVPRRYL
jgi:hypothetical protein